MRRRVLTPRERASTAPRDTRTVGSPEWCYQTANLMKNSYRFIHRDQDNFVNYLNELRTYKAWEVIPVEGPYGSEDAMLLAEIGKRFADVDAEIEAVKRGVRETKAKAIEAQTPDLPSQGRPGKGSDNKNGTTFSAKRGNDYAIARLRRDRPDIHARVLAGEITAHAGMVEAGFRKLRPSRRQSALQKIIRLLPRLTASERRKLHELTS